MTADETHSLPEMDAERTGDENRLLDLFRQADDEAKCAVMLLTIAFTRGDEVLAAGFHAMGLTQRTDGTEDVPFAGFPLLERLKEVCPMNERIWWARYTCQLLMRRDEALLDALTAQMQRRIAC